MAPKRGVDYERLAKLDAEARCEAAVESYDLALQSYRRAESVRDQVTALTEMRQIRKELRDEDAHVGAAKIADFEAMLAKFDRRAQEIRGAKPARIAVPKGAPGAKPVH